MRTPLTLTLTVAALTALTGCSGDAHAAPSAAPPAPTPAPTAASVAPDTESAGRAEAAAGTRSPRHTPAKRGWLRVISRHARAGSERAADDEPRSDLRIDLPVRPSAGGGDGERAVSLPVVVLPVPVSGRASHEYHDSGASFENDDEHEDDARLRARTKYDGGGRSASSGGRGGSGNSGNREDVRAHSGTERAGGRFVVVRLSAGDRHLEQKKVVEVNTPQRGHSRSGGRGSFESALREHDADDEGYLDDADDYERVSPPQRARPRPPSPPPPPRGRYSEREPPRRRPTAAVGPPLKSTVRPVDRTREPSRPRSRPRLRDEQRVPDLMSDDFASSAVLVEHYRAQAPRDEHLPPVLLPKFLDEPTRGRGRSGTRSGSASLSSDVLDVLDELVAPDQIRPAADPPRPRFERSLQLRAELTVPHSDYTERYRLWWDASSGASRAVFHDGTASAYRIPAQGGRQRLVETYVDRSGPRTLRRCGVASEVATASYLGPPGLPDLDRFSFSGFVDSEDGPAESWRYEVQGRAGQLGAARGERLLYHHELLLLRTDGDSSTAMPLRYSVTVDSSVLGPGADGYEHRYLEVREWDPAPELFRIDVDEECDAVRELDPTDPEHSARLDPLREFVLPTRDRRYDAAVLRFKDDFQRRYADDTEEAVRKALYVHKSRFVSSCNRQGATFEAQINYLTDRLNVELEQLLGVAPQPQSTDAERFPYSDAELDDADVELPVEFNWRDLGGVSRVQDQNPMCMSCWAFAVAGAVEGAMFARTGRLVPLSPQCLVDCAHKTGANGCNNSWPSAAYEYARDFGLRTLDEYTPYNSSVLQCKDDRVPPVAYISGYVDVAKHSVPALKVAIMRHGPTVVIIHVNPTSFVPYNKGVYADERCGTKPRDLNHAVLAVGWGEHAELGTYFIVKNSWSANWGESGYINMAATSNTCGILTSPSYPNVRADDVRRSSAGSSRPGPGARSRLRVRPRPRPRAPPHRDEFGADD